MLYLSASLHTLAQFTVLSLCSIPNLNQKVRTVLWTKIYDAKHLVQNPLLNCKRPTKRGSDHLRRAFYSSLAHGNLKTCFITALFSKLAGHFAVSKYTSVTRMRIASSKINESIETQILIRRTYLVQSNSHNNVCRYHTQKPAPSVRYGSSVSKNHHNAARVSLSSDLLV